MGEPRVWKVEFILWVWTVDGHGWFNRHAELPFVPYPGLRIDFEGFGADDADTIKEVAWLSAQERFVCHMEPDQGGDWSWAEEIDIYTTLGWKLTEGVGHTPRRPQPTTGCRDRAERARR